MPLGHDSTFVPVEIFRVLRGLKQYELAQTICISEQALRNKVAGNRPWAPGELEGLADVLEVPPSVLGLTTQAFVARLTTLLTEDSCLPEKIA